MKLPFGEARGTTYAVTGGDPFNSPKPSSPPASPTNAQMDAEFHNSQGTIQNLSSMLKARRAMKGKPKMRSYMQ